MDLNEVVVMEKSLDYLVGGLEGSVHQGMCFASG